MAKTNLNEKQKFLFLTVKHNFFDVFLSILVLVSILIIISNPAIFSNATISGLKLFFYSVLPGLFPFMFLTKTLTEIGLLYKVTNKFSGISRRFFGTPGVSMYVLSMSMLSGYPIGAKIISDLYQKGQITEKDAKKMSLFCTTSGPIFVIGSVGAIMLSNIKFGIIIYCAHIASSIILGMLANILTKEKTIKNDYNYPAQNTKQANIFSHCLNETVASVMMIGAYITIFYLICELLVTLNIIPAIAESISMLIKNRISKDKIQAIIFGIIEVTRGCKELSIISPRSLSIICGLISFSGISIIMQSLAFLNTAKIKAHTFFLFKCVHAILSIIICKLIVIFCCI